MIAATRITTGPYRIARRLVRKAIKPLLLAVNRHQMVLSEGNVLALEGARLEAVELMRDEHQRQVKLMMKQREIGSW